MLKNYCILNSSLLLCMCCCEKDDFSESFVVQKLWNLRWLKPLPLLDQIIFTPNIKLRISQMYHYSAFHGVLIFEILIQALFQNS